MTNRFFEALTTKNLRGENGMPTHSSSGSFVVDLFFKMGGYRKNGNSLSELVSVFYAAFGENPTLAVKCLFYLRDPRRGMGERYSGRILWHTLANSHPELVKKLLPYIPAHSRWDDLFYFLDTPVEKDAMWFLFHAITQGDKLAAKWTTREGKRGPKEFKKGVLAKYLMKQWKMLPTQYRDFLVKNTQVVETLMCQNRWDDIVFEHVPGNAMKNYRDAFKKHQEERYAEYLAAVTKGEKKINTSALSPVDIVHQYFSHYQRDDTLEALWANLKDVIPAEIAFLPICDVSGSMNGVPMEVSVSLGIYCSQHNKSIFKDGFITFSQKPTFVRLTEKTLLGKIQQVRSINLAENTDLEAVFVLILESAKRAKLSEEDMPTHLLIISDMQFDECMGKNKPSQNSWGFGLSSLAKRFDDTALEMIDRMYQEAGYTRPNIIFWNVRTSEGIPAKITDNGTALVSGYSPNVLSSVLSGTMNPINQVLAILNESDYDFVDEIMK